MEAEKEEMVIEEVQEVEAAEVDSDVPEEVETDSEETEGEEKQLEPWEEVEEDLPDKPITVHAQIKQRRKFQKREETIKSENEKLKAELEQIKKSGVKKDNTLPREEDFDSWDEFKEAEAKYTQNLIQSQIQTERQQVDAKKDQDKVMKEVGNHYVRVDSFLNETGVKKEIYDNSDEVVRGVLEEVFPGNGDYNFERLISQMGPGSEKVTYFIGRNKAEFQSKLISDPSGIEAAIYLGQKLEQFNGSSGKKRQSKAPVPASSANGADTNATSISAKAFKKKYDAAHKAGNGTEAFNIKRSAKREHKIDTKDW